MHLADLRKHQVRRDIRRQWAKIVLLAVVSLGLLVFSVEVLPSNLFEPQSIGWVLWVSYAKDLFQPFAFYFFLCLGERWLKTWRSRALLAFAVPALLEFGQAFYYQVFRGHYVGAFDPIDLLVYAMGVGLAALVEQKIFARVLKFW
jgi:hypothetical protein